MVLAKHRLKSASPEKQQMDAPAAGFRFGQNSREFATLHLVFEPRRTLFQRGGAIVADSAVLRTPGSNRAPLCAGRPAAGQKLPPAATKRLIGRWCQRQEVLAASSGPDGMLSQAETSPGDPHPPCSPISLSDGPGLPG
jgi:hypothetical protein